MEVRKFNAGKYYYLDVLDTIASELNEAQRYQLYKELEELHDNVGSVFDKKRSEEFLSTFGKYGKGNNVQCAEFFVTIYLAMLDLESNKDKYPNSLGKTMVLRSCKAVILENKDPKEAAVMFKRGREDATDD